jgi:cytochrome c oxidase subunit 2
LDNGCINCHSTDGSKITGPSFLDLAKGFTNIKENGKIKKVKIDSDYIRESILKPNKKIVSGFRKFSMPEIADDISKNDFEKIIKLLTPDDK